MLCGENFTNFVTVNRVILWAMKNIIATYRSEYDLLMNPETSLRATYTPPYNTNNQIVGRDGAALNYILALPLGTLCAR